MICRDRSLQKTPLFFLTLVFSICFSSGASAQYFGRNKVNYEQFDFKVLETPHFEIYHYLANDAVKNRIAQQTEQWYRMHQLIFRDTFREKNPMILYNIHAHFQQTNTISGLIGVGTGGVTEALKNRVIMPFLESNAQTDHVLGHELVHAFQYNLVRESDSLSLNSLNNLPLWMVEGLAEYMSIGYIDPHTSIWLRSAVLNDKIPTVKLLTNRPYEYFPYRWGQAFWSYVTGTWSDTIIRRLFVATARYGYEDAFKRVLGMTEKVFSEKWKESIRNMYSPFKQSTSLVAAGTVIAGRRNAGKINIVPSMSPDGKLFAFWSEKDVFNLDLFLADAASGRVIKKLTSTSFSSHIDEFSSYESTVAWSPDSRELAFIAFAKGKNKLIIENTAGKILQELDIPGVDGLTNPTWSPDGKTIVVSGLVNGQTDLYAFNLETKTVKRLTNDKYAELQPSWSPDGKWLVFSTDRNSFIKVQHHFSHDLALMNVGTGQVETLNVFEGANNLNPVFSADNSTIYFVSDRDGFRNLYSYQLQNREIAQLTNLYTGITGITLYAPAISVSRQTDQLLYTYYDKDEYSIYSVNVNSLAKKIVENTNANMNAAMLPPSNRNSDIVQNNIRNTPFAVVEERSFINKPYRSKFQLDYLGNTGGIGVSTGAFRSGASGGVQGIFSDMLGNHQLFGMLALNGEVYDFGGQFAYLNAAKRLNWGASVSHIPYLSGLQRLFLDTLVLNGTDTTQVANLSTDILRTYQDQLSVFAAYPFSQTRRIEAGGSFARYYYRLDRYTDYYTTDLQFFIGSSRRQKLPTPKGFNFGEAYVAFVGDNSQFGVASPLIGHRFRLEAGHYFGVINMNSVLGDYRKYFRLAPFTIATRNMYLGRFGKDAETGILPPLYIGYPFLIRGYEAIDFAEQPTGEEVSINDLIGSRIFITNAELRFPFTGPERLSAIRSRFVLTELNLFTDGGIAWGNPGSPTSDPKQNIIPKSSRFVLSSGISLRLNLFGYLVIEPYYAIPWQNGGFKNGSFGVNFLPGW